MWTDCVRSKAFLGRNTWRVHDLSLHPCVRRAQYIFRGLPDATTSASYWRVVHRSEQRLALRAHASAWRHHAVPAGDQAQVNFLYRAQEKRRASSRRRQWFHDHGGAWDDRPHGCGLSCHLRQEVKSSSFAAVIFRPENAWRRRGQWALVCRDRDLFERTGRNRDLGSSSDKPVARNPGCLINFRAPAMDFQDSLGGSADLA